MPNLPGAQPSPVLRPSGLRPRSLSEVAAHLGVPALSAGDGPLPDVQVTGVTLDSRSVQPGDLYAAPAGARAHGADYSAVAAETGAVACLTDPAGADRARAAGLTTYIVESPRQVLGRLAAWVYGDPAESLTMIGVTGTNGKTTTAYLLEAGLQGAGIATGLIGTIETRIGAEVVPSVRTTPEAPDLQALLAVMSLRGVRAVAMEVSSHALAMGRVDGTTYDVAIFTNLTEDHLDFHHDLEDYYSVKASLFTARRARRGVVDVDDSYGRRLATETEIPVVTVSTAGNEADWRALDADLGPLGSTFALHGPDGVQVACSTRLAGDFNLADAALAVVALVEAGLDPQQAADGVARCPGVPGRMERVTATDPENAAVQGELTDPGTSADHEAPAGPLALVDFAHSPDALERVLTTARGLVPAGGRLLVVIGCGGDRDPYKRPGMGALAVGLADVAVLTSDNPRSEDPLAIIEAMRRGADDALRDGATGRLEVEPDRRAAVTLAVSLAGPSDVVVVAGKGHEQGQEIGGVVTPFDDRVVLAQALTNAAAMRTIGPAGMPETPVTAP